MKTSVQEMLRKPPVARPVMEPGVIKAQDMINEMTTIKAHEAISYEVELRQKAERELELQKTAWAAVAESLTNKIKELEQMQADLVSERTARTAAEQRITAMTADLENMRGQYTSESNLRASAVTRHTDTENEVRRLKTELDSALSQKSLIKSELERSQSELSRAKLAVQTVKAATPPSLQPFELQITSRDANGGIKTIAMVPKKVN